MPLKIPPGPSRAPNLVQMRDLSGGANLATNRFNLPPNQFAPLENFYLSEDGSLLGRRGTSRWNAVSLGPTVVQGAKRAYFDAGNHWLAYHNGEIWKGTDATKSFASTLGGLSTSSDGWFWQYLAYVYFTNKAVQRKWDGTAWTTMGLAAPGSAPALAVGAAGTPNGTYTCKATFFTATIESNPSAASASVSVVNQKIDVSGIPIGPAGTAGRKLYFFKTGASSVYQLAITVNDNTTTTATLTTDQPSWTTAAPSTNDVPPPAIFGFVVFKNRLWGFDGRRLYFSQVYLPEAYPSAYYVDIPFSQNDVITALFVLGDVLLVFGHTEVYYVVGDSPFSFVIRRSAAPAGCPGPWAVDKLGTASAAYLSRHGVYEFDAAAARPMSDAIDPHFSGLLPDYAQMNYAAADKATLKWYDRLKAIVLSFPTGVGTTNDMTWWWFQGRRGWVEDTRDARMFLAADGKGDAGDLYAWDVDAGILRQWDPSGVYTDDGISITARFRTGNADGGRPVETKPWTWFTLRAKPANIVVQVDARVDDWGDTDSFTVNLARGVAYGTGVYGTTTYAGEFDDFEERLAPNMKGRAISFECAATYDSLYHLAGIFVSHDVVPTPRRKAGV